MILERIKHLPVEPAIQLLRDRIKDAKEKRKQRDLSPGFDDP